MKQFIRTALIAALFIAALVLMMQQGPDEGPLHLWDFSIETLQKVEVKSPDLNYTLAQEDGTWIAQQGDAMFPIDAQQLAARLHPLLHLHAKSILGGAEAPASDYARYGLDAADLSLSLEGTDGTEETLWIGQRTALKDNFYARRVGHEAIYLFSVYDLEGFFRGDFLEKIKAPAVPTPPAPPPAESTVQTNPEDTDH